MADSFTATLNLRKPEVGHANDTWGGTAAGLNGDLDIIDAIFLATGLGTAVGLHVGAAQVLNVEGGITLKDPVDITKVAVLDRSLISTATTRTYQFPDQSGVLALKTDKPPTGTVLSGYYGGTAPAGFVFLIGRSIGDVASGATERANADTVNLFSLFWGLGFTPTGGRGASAAADFAAHKPMPLPDHRGRVMAAIDQGGSAILSGAGTSTNRGGVLGAATEAATVSVSGSATGALTVIGGGTTQTDFSAGNPNVQGLVGGLLVSASPHQHNFTISGNTTGSMSVSATGATASQTNAQPTIMVDVVIAL